MQRRSKTKLWLALGAIALSSALPSLRAADLSVSTPSATRAMSEAVGAMLSGDGIRARKTLVAIPSADLAPTDEGFRTCAIGRLDGRDHAIDPTVKDVFVRKLLRIYRRYWSEVELAPPAQRPTVEANLLRSLHGLVGPGAPREIEALEPLVSARFRKAGYQGLNGVTAPLHELMLWSREDEHHYQVQLPEGAQDVRVVFLDRFVSGGWSSYLSCGRTGTGGWTKPEGIYAVRSGYPDLESEQFRVSLLAHEGQHFYDNDHFPTLRGWELEYRAKLVEIIGADKTRERLIRSFEVNQSDDPTVQHGFADRKLLADLRRRLNLPAGGDLRSMPWPAVQAAARDELTADTLSRTTAKPN